MALQPTEGLAEQEHQQREAQHQHEHPERIDLPEGCRSHRARPDQGCAAAGGGGGGGGAAGGPSGRAGGCGSEQERTAHTAPPAVAGTRAGSMRVSSQMEMTPSPFTSTGASGSKL